MNQNILFLVCLVVLYFCFSKKESFTTINKNKFKTYSLDHIQNSGIIENDIVLQHVKEQYPSMIPMIIITLDEAHIGLHDTGDNKSYIVTGYENNRGYITEEISENGSLSNELVSSQSAIISNTLIQSNIGQSQLNNQLLSNTNTNTNYNLNKSTRGENNVNVLQKNNSIINNNIA